MAMPGRDEYIEHFLHESCDGTTPLLAAGTGHYFEPGATLLLSTAGCGLRLLARRYHSAKEQAEDPRDVVTRLVVGAAVLPRELQRSMARELRQAFPDMPPIRDFVALAATSQDATAAVRALHGGSSSAIGAMAKQKRRGGGGGGLGLGSRDDGGVGEPPGLLSVAGMRDLCAVLSGGVDGGGGGGSSSSGSRGGSASHRGGGGGGEGGSMGDLEMGRPLGGPHEHDESDDESSAGSDVSAAVSFVSRASKRMSKTGKGSMMEAPEEEDLDDSFLMDG